MPEEEKKSQWTTRYGPKGPERGVPQLTPEMVEDIKRRKEQRLKKQKKEEQRQNKSTRPFMQLLKKLSWRSLFFRL